MDKHVHSFSTVRVRMLQDRQYEADKRCSSCGVERTERGIMPLGKWVQV